MGKTIRTIPNHWNRSPRTSAEKRAYYDAIEQGVKPRRSPRHIPSDYDDKPIAARKEAKYANP